MTISHHLTEHLATLGIFAEDSSAILDAVQASMPSMADHWLKDTGSYNEPMLATLRLATRSAAIQHLTAHKPGHFALGSLG